MPLDPRIAGVVQSDENPLVRLSQRVQDLEKLVGQISARAVGPRMAYIGSFTLTDSNRAFQFDNIPQHFRSLMIIGAAKSAVTITYRQLGLRMNGGATAAYQTQEFSQVDGGAATPSWGTGLTYARIGHVPGGSAPNDNYWGSVEVLIPRYSATIGVKQFMFRNQAFGKLTGNAPDSQRHLWGISSEDFTGGAVTSLTILLDPYEAFNTTVSAFDLYGLP